MTEPSRLTCVLCAASECKRPVVHGRNGHVCFSCLGEAFAAVARSHGTGRGPDRTPSGADADGECLLCDRRITDTVLVAERHPYFFCAECLELVFAIALRDGPATFALVRF